MAKNRLTLNFKGFQEYMEKLDRLGADTQHIAEEALRQTHAAVTPGIEAAIAPHDFTGKTHRSLVTDARIESEGTIIKVPVGFDINAGGIAHIFLMYGTPKIAPDSNLYNSIYGTSTKTKARKVQKQVFDEELKKVMG